MSTKQDHAESEGIRLYRLHVWGQLTLIPLTALFIATAWLANSASVIVICVQSAIAIVINSFSLYALHQVVRNNVYQFAYGAGKLENFSAFLLGVFYVPSGLYLAVNAIDRLHHPPVVGYELSQVAIVFSALRMLVLYLLVRRLARQSKNPSPLLRSTLLDYRLCWINDLGVCVALFIAWACIGIEAPGIGSRIDPSVALAIALYMLWIGASLVWHNFRALVDLPLPEKQQIEIMRVLAHHYQHYDSIGTVFSRASGNRRFVEIEMGFAGNQTIEHVQTLSLQMENDLTAKVPGLSFKIFPMVHAPSTSVDFKRTEAGTTNGKTSDAQPGASPFQSL